MTPRIQRPEPPYLQLVAHYRTLIKDGELKSGTRLPATRELADQWQVSHTTVAKAVTLLRSEGLVETSNQGTTVSFGETNTYTPRDRLRAMKRSGRIYPHSEATRILAAAVVPAPEHVAAAMGIEEGDQVVRRERVTLHGDVPVTHSVTWMPGELVDSVPELATTERIPGGTVGAVRERTGREVTRDTYRECARRATAEIAAALEVAEGDPVLYGQNTWYEDSGAVLEFGEFTIPEGRWISVV
ncbi:MAG: GntR family transcriptional regulator [Nocardiopsaceae bacterium]|nr:GntR family transcriptional regulator [Nocardiopsaceae bacterium]